MGTNKMKSLVVFYSRTGTTKKAAEDISKTLKCDIEEIIDLKNRHGLWGYFISGKDAGLKKLTKIKETLKNPKDYDLIIIGTPVWAHNMAPAVRTYLSQNKELMKKVAFFCTFGCSGAHSAFKNMKNVCGKAPVALLALKTSEVMRNNYFDKLNDFIKAINREMS